jgi:4-hydroxy-tetrahydrodipicolinate synthase
MAAKKTLHTLAGTGVAVVTPFKANGSVDYDSLTKVINHIIKGKCEYLVINGTTAESPCLTKDEKAAILRHAIEVVKLRVPVVYGVGGNNTAEVVENLMHTDFTGVSAILSVAPYYNKPNQEGLYQHYKAVSKASPLPVILYNVPGRTGMNMAAATTIRLAKEFPNLIGIKEASGNMEQIMQILRDRPSDFLVISGDDLLTLPMIACGANGVISVVANAFPKMFSDMVRTSLAGDFKTAGKNHYKLMQVTQQFFADGNPGGVKVSLAAQKLCTETLRLPLMPVNRSLRAQIIAETSKLLKG